MPVEVLAGTSSMLGGPIPPPPFTKVPLGPIDVHVFGIIVALAMFAGWTVIRRRYLHSGGDGDALDRVMFAAVVSGFIGARLGYVATNLDRYQGQWLDVLMIRQGGLVLFGGLIVGTSVAVLMARRHDLELPAFADAAAIGVPLAQAIGRPADYFSQELYGTPTNLPWAVQVPEAARPAAFADAATFHPAFFYESIWSFATVGLLLWVARRELLPRGRLFFVYAAAYGVGRFALEQIRTDTTFRLLGLSRNAWIALIVATIAVAVLLIAHRRDRARSADVEVEPTGTVADAAGQRSAPPAAQDRP